MLSKTDVDMLEKLTGQLEAHHKEIGALAKRSPVDAVNPFKLKFINSTLAESNTFLGAENRPFSEFEVFETDDVPSNSDVTFMLASYLQAIEKFRADNIVRDGAGWYYRMDQQESKIRTSPPAKLKD